MISDPVTHSTRFDCIIAGSGLVGAAAAVALAREGLHVALLDAAPSAERVQPAYDGRTSAIAYASRLILSHLGIWQRIGASEPITDIRVCDENAPQMVHYDCREVGGEPFGHIVENRLLRAALLAAVADEKQITLIEPVKIDSVEEKPGQLAVTLSNGQTVTTPLLLVADGKFSQTRSLLGIAPQFSHYGQTALVVTIIHTLPHQGLAVERFLPAGPFAILPMCDDAAGRHRSNIVWSESDAMAARLMALSAAELKPELQARIGDHLGDIEVGPARHSYPLMLVQAQRLWQPRCLLIGDAAHGIHPIAGQGVNLGYRDVAMLHELVLEQARLGLDIGADALLSRYASARSGDVHSMAQMTDGLNRLFSNHSIALKHLRRAGLDLVQHVPPVKRFFMRHAMGMAGHVPPLMQPLPDAGERAA